MNWHDLGTKMVKTRKKHFCWGCGQRIEPGTTVRHNAGILEGEGYFHTYYCAPCAAFMDSEHFDWEDHRDNGLGFQDLLCYDEYKDFAEKFDVTNKQ